MSTTGVLAYRGRLGGDTQLTWFDRAGRQLDLLGPRGEYLNPNLSPDGRRAAVERVTSGNRDVWLVEIERGVPSRFTFDPAPDFEPVWLPDSRHVVFASNRQGATAFFQKAITEPAEEPLAKPGSAAALFDVSSDGRFLVYQRLSTVGLWILPLTGENRKPVPFIETPVFQETHAQLSPDGRWIAYVSNESGSDEVYIQHFPTPGLKQQVSTNGGVQPRWRRDGRELFYLAPDLKLMAVSVSGQDALTFGHPAALFPAAVFGGTSRAPMFRQQYDVAPDGQRFLLNVPAATGAGSPGITVVVNWTSGLPARETR
jgi:Tol biopolymer transport system component